jgi:hypothetical protein
MFVSRMIYVLSSVTSLISLGFGIYAIYMLDFFMQTDEIGTLGAVTLFGTCVLLITFSILFAATAVIAKPKT